MIFNTNPLPIIFMHSLWVLGAVMATMQVVEVYRVSRKKKPFET